MHINFVQLVYGAIGSVQNQYRTEFVSSDVRLLADEAQETTVSVEKFTEIYSFGSGRNRSKSEAFSIFGSLVSTGIPDTAFLSFLDKL